METITWQDFTKVELRVGTIIDVESFPEARKPAYKLTVDFGTCGILRSSAQLTARYTPDSLRGKQIIGVINFPSKNIAGFLSQCLVTGVPNEQEEVVLISLDSAVPNGAKVF